MFFFKHVTSVMPFSSQISFTSDYTSTVQLLVQVSAINNQSVFISSRGLRQGITFQNWTLLLSKVPILERRSSSLLYRREQTVTTYRDLVFNPPIVSFQREARQVYLHVRHDAVYSPTNLPMFLPNLLSSSSFYIIIFTVNVKLANSSGT